MRVTLEKFWFASDAETMALVLYYSQSKNIQLSIDDQ